ncbi:hypothetical protein N2152v2_000129 [Parachlorella kessleri]
MTQESQGDRQLSWEEQSLYRYQLIVDGHGATYNSAVWKLLSGSLAVRLRPDGWDAPIFEQFYDPLFADVVVHSNVTGLPRVVEESVSTDCLVGVQPEVVFEAQPECQRLFFPVLSFDGGAVNDAWCGSCLHFVCGGLGEGGVFFRLLPGKRLSYLGTASHPTSSFLGFPPPTRVFAGTSLSLLRQPLLQQLAPLRLERPVHPGYVHLVEHTPGQSESDDEGYADAPVVYLGGDTGDVPASRTPCCCDCRRRMRFVGELSCGAFAEDLFDVPITLFFCHGCGVQCCLDDADVVILDED